MDVSLAESSLRESCNLIAYLGIEFISTPKPDVCVARMPVDGRNTHPFGALSGGATLALAETLAGVGSVTILNGAQCAGLNVSCTHVRPAKSGDTVTATARLLHKGRKTHLWSVDVYNQDGLLISQVSVTNFVLSPQ